MENVCRFCEEKNSFAELLLLGNISGRNKSFGLINKSALGNLLQRGGVKQMR